MKIAVLSRSDSYYSTQRLLEAGTSRGHEMERIDYVKSHMFIGTGEGDVSIGSEQKSYLDAVIPRIGATKTFYGAAVVRQFETCGAYSINPSIAIVRARDKLRSLQILSKHNVNIPKTAFACTPENVNSIIENVGGPPVIIKLLEGTQGIGVVLADTYKAAKSVIEAFYGMKVNILIQEFIKEAKSSDLRTIVIGGKVVASMMRRGDESDFRSNLHRGGKGEKVKLTKEEKAIAIAASKAMNLPFCGVDMLRSARGPLILEVNSSPGLEGIETVTGVDVASKVIEFIEKDSSKRKRDSVGA
ncbi:alpha-L-glutamate ligase, RimK family [Denitrovibrio acetiphilus DSM 12809]|jgi:ribosomal protein S6--L-glutamate ligase|uniref:Probable alpha-L-glutamate ligase n=1 Tax=Denitrovibrio acetiphilus (strain DSM 12809 / NBRC 114555 / N2460) TaxID=522772 RepID=D4H7A5_DENA2|nr:30S ribosomal protein S6--L-glutamate ligase [Denitrovibrio acetiphilus]ADD67904.1 alpha-L-glutamate ligase, RimK family [Denitrovibrio acetiphilus DSM 12809]